MSPLGAVHTTFALLSVAIGALVLLLPKGTRWHRTVGHAYAWAMAVAIGTAFFIYDLTGAFGPFHVAALIGAVTLAGGLYTVLGRRPRGSWMEGHAIWMSWSYIGLVAALFAETLTRFVMPRAAPLLEGRALWGVFWTAVALASFAVFGLGAWLVKHRLPETLRSTPQAMRAERQRLRDLDAAGAEDSST